MATDDISVSIGVQGESKFKKALAECQNTVKQLDSALKANAAEYEANADALGENVERTKLLSKSIELQKKMAEGLGDAIEHATKEYGAASRQTTQYVVAQNKAKEAVAKLEKELKESDRELEELGRDSVRVGRQLEQGIGEGAEDAANKLDRMMDDIRGELESISGSVGISATVDIIKNTIDGINGLIDSAEEYRTSMSFVSQAARDWGHDQEVVEGHVLRVAAATRELDAAAEGMNNLIGAGFDAKELADATDLMLAAAVKFPDTYKFESLAESLRNTIEEGKAVGQFSELLLAMGVDLEAFDKAMEKASDKERRQDIALSFSANRGLEETISEYEKANEEMIKGAAAALILQREQAKLAEQAQPVATAWTEMTTAVVGAVSSILENTEVDEWIIGVIGNIKELAELVSIWTNDEKLEEFAEGKKQERQEMIESGTAETEGEALLRQMGKPEWYIEWYRGRAQKDAKETGTEIGTDIADGTVSEIEASGDDMKTAMDDAMKQVNDSMIEKRPEITAEAQNLADGITDAMNSVSLPDIEGYLYGIYDALNRAPSKLPNGWNIRGGIAPEATNPMIVSFKFSEKTFASATFPTINEMLGREINVNV